MKTYDEMQAHRENKTIGDQHTDDTHHSIKCKLNSKADEYGIFIEYYNKHINEKQGWCLADFMEDDSFDFLESGNDKIAVLISKAQYLKILKKERLKKNKAGTSLGVQLSIEKLKEYGALVIDKTKSYSSVKQSIKVFCEDKL